MFRLKNYLQSSMTQTTYLMLLHVHKDKTDEIHVDLNVIAEQFINVNE